MSDLIQNLVNKLHDANRAYRDGSPYLSDAEFDVLEEQLRIIDPNNEWFKKGVNDATPKKRKVKLPHPMMSLDKVKTIDNLLAWVNKFTDTKFVITPKFDGLSVGLNGDVSWTRGDGIIGQDCTKQLMHTNKPHATNITENSVIRGEIIFTNANWELFKKDHPEAVSSRNSATGLINGDFDANRISDYGLLSIMPYEIVGSDMPKECQLNYLGTDIYETVQASQLNDEFLLNLYVKWKNLYPIDGLVIDVNNPIHRTGTEANGNPSYTIAYKSPKFSETGTGIIKEIELNVNRYGIVTPVVILEEPIFLSGAMISRVSAINMNYVLLWGLFPGEKITIVRSGEVIPKIIGVGNVVIPFRETYNTVGDYLSDYNSNSTQR
jgi:NAD-dependent DNA ligase